MRARICTWVWTRTRPTTLSLGLWRSSFRSRIVQLMESKEVGSVWQEDEDRRLYFRIIYMMKVRLRFNQIEFNNIFTYLTLPV
jgi:hypothetical protein